jgi:hypothetical protein
MNVKNKQLNECLQLLSQRAYSSYGEELRLDDRFQKDLSYVAIELYKLDQKIIELPEFKLCCSLMEKDEKIKALQGQMVGSYSYRSIVEDEESCILSFLKQLYLESQKYDQDLFNQKYLAFEEFFYSDFFAFKDSARLYNFAFNENELVLGHGITIRKEENLNTLQDDYMEKFFTSPVAIFSKSTYLLERNYETKKIVGELSKQDELKLGTELSTTDDLFDLTINALRILRSSAVYRDHRIKTEDKTFHPIGGKTVRSSTFENIAIGEICNIQTTDIATLCKVFEFLFTEKDSRFHVARRRLSVGTERKSPEDRLIDYMIGLEALYLPDGNAELSFRLSMRVAFLLSSGTGKKDTFNFLRKMYDIRSSIVHGNKYDLNAEDIKKLEELLRKSVTLWIEDKNNFSKNQLNKIFFDVEG